MSNSQVPRTRRRVKMPQVAASRFPSHSAPPHRLHVLAPALPQPGRDDADAPSVRLRQLDHLWFQLTGTLCNLTCTHCFISCSPSNHAFEFLETATVLAALELSTRLGVKEYYFTGGEPFMHPDLVPILRRTLEIGPATVLTNGTLLRPAVIDELTRLRDGSIYSLEIRVSIDGADAAGNDAIRGRHAFARAIAGVERLVGAGFLPIVTMAQTWDDADAQSVYEQMRGALLAIRYTRPRIKLLPSLKLGQEVIRSRGYDQTEYVTREMMREVDEASLICAHGRIITSRGVHVCPILIEQPDSLLAPDLETAVGAPYALRHAACLTCWMSGAICSNASSAAGFKERAR